MRARCGRLRLITEAAIETLHRFFDIADVFRVEIFREAADAPAAHLERFGILLVARAYLLLLDAATRLQRLHIFEAGKLYRVRERALVDLSAAEELQNLAKRFLRPAPAVFVAHQLEVRAPAPLAALPVHDHIGRASCRERV